MRSLMWALMVALLLNLLAAAGFVGWLVASGRVNQQRLERIADIFRLTIQDQQAHDEQMAAERKGLEEEKEAADRLEAAADGLKTMHDRLSTADEALEIDLHTAERLRRERSDIERHIDVALRAIAEQTKQLDQDRQAFQKFTDDQTRKLRDEAFAQTVGMYEQLKPKQAKKIFQELMAQGHTNQIVDYLSAMNLRNAGKILKEFKADNDIPQATILLEKLRQRGAFALENAMGQEVNQP